MYKIPHEKTLRIFVKYPRIHEIMNLFSGGVNMIYPKFIEKNESIGVCAPSAGMGGKIEEFEASKRLLEEEGYHVKETASVRKNSARSASAAKRAKELDELVNDDEVKMIITATGGDYMLEMVPKIDFDNIVKHPKWIMGASDPTNLLYPLTTKYDIATMYGFNLSYDTSRPLYVRNNLEFLKGNLVKQKSSSYHFDFLADEKTAKKIQTRWISKTDVKTEGRLIGGCLDCIATLLGTKYDGGAEFIERYKEDGILWYFDIFAMTPLTVYLTLLQLKNLGYFRYCKGVIFSRVAFPNVTDITYEEAYRRALGKIPYVCEADNGHSHPKLTLINGCYAKVKVKDGKGEIVQILK